ncbi:histone H1 protein [Thioalkalivibrio denitrificans]|uniref:Histone H1 protein n=1 Tax=Thioalkalivibrio denitrificans TaxID=108003 RepID=A0A1V3NIS0_9GAMM|nr:histone H1 protein [Thioalkalivibrio denitrificans]OOG24945.1 histone H1 protein [Thioalkalivibrio denitrificans]
MSDIQSKLAAGVREARKQQDEPKAGKAEAAKSRPAPKTPAPAKAPAPAADDANQVPPNTGDDPWADLHPRRVWPD